MNTQLLVEFFICYEDSARDGRVIFKLSHILDLHKLFSIFRSSTLYLSFSVSLTYFPFFVFSMAFEKVLTLLFLVAVVLKNVTKILLVGEKMLMETGGQIFETSLLFLVAVVLKNVTKILLVGEKMLMETGGQLFETSKRLT